MASRNITFDTESGVPLESNFTIYGGTDFSATFNIKNTSNSAFDLTNYSGSGAISKSVSIGATLGITTSFTVGVTNALGGELNVSLGSTATRELSEGRYVYDVLITDGSTVYPLVTGNIIVSSPVSSAP